MVQNYCFIKEIKIFSGMTATLSKVPIYLSSFQATGIKRLYFFKSEDFKMINERNAMHIFRWKLGLG